MITELSGRARNPALIANGRKGRRGKKGRKGRKGLTLNPAFMGVSATDLAIGTATAIGATVIATAIVPKIPGLGSVPGPLAVALPSAGAAALGWLGYKYGPQAVKTYAKWGAIFAAAFAVGSLTRPYIEAGMANIPGLSGSWGLDGGWGGDEVVMGGGSIAGLEGAGLGGAFMTGGGGVDGSWGAEAPSLYGAASFG